MARLLVVPDQVIIPSDRAPLLNVCWQTNRTTCYKKLAIYFVPPIFFIQFLLNQEDLP